MSEEFFFINVNVTVGPRYFTATILYRSEDDRQDGLVELLSFIADKQDESNKKDMQLLIEKLRRT